MWIIILLVGISSCMLTPNKKTESMNFEQLDYLVDITSDRVNQFTDTENKNSLERLTKDPRFKKTYSEILSIVTAKDKLPQFHFVGTDLYDFWQDQIHIRGILRKTSVTKLNSGNPDWITVLDIDELSKTENKNWVWKGFECLEPLKELCLVNLSDGGKDAKTIREFNLKTKKFVENGFYFPESKTEVTWIDENTLFVCDGTDPNTLSNSGYPTIVKKLKRGQTLEKSEIIFTANKSDVSAALDGYYRNGKNHFILSQSETFYSGKRFLVSDDRMNPLQQIPIPDDAEFVQIFNDQFLFSNRSDFKIKDISYKPGSVFSFSLKQLINPELHVVFTPSKTQFFEFAISTKNFLIATVLDDVKKSILKYKFSNNQWVNEKLQLGDTGNTAVMTFTREQDQVYLTYSSFLNPTQYHYYDLNNPKSHKKVMTAPERFDSKNLIAHQYKVKSSDGTSVPYFIVHSKNIKLNGLNPTVLYGYGGFEITMSPHYLGATGKAWLEKGGVYVLANIRGGGEYGPDWHKSALKENRQRAFDDFYAVAEDLISRKITSPQHLGIWGGSNGGLLTSVAFTQRPELFNAVLSEVPLTNMLQYHKWLSGNSWMAEYGNPDMTKEREYILKYSPLHNLSPSKKYPEVFYITSTKDDRVHPAHARQMVARMREQNHPVIYFENKDGGHAGAANMNEYAKLLSLKYIYLFQKLF